MAPEPIPTDFFGMSLLKLPAHQPADLDRKGPLMKNDPELEAGLDKIRAALADATN